MEILVFSGSDSEKLKYAIDIRTEVFIKEQGVSSEDEFDDKDPVSDYVLIKNQNKYVGCGRAWFLNNTAHFGRIAVTKNARKSGVGRIIIEKLIEISKAKGADIITLGAQLQAVGFYEKLGFKAYGDVYLDANIKHINMNLS